MRFQNQFEQFFVFLNYRKKMVHSALFATLILLLQTSKMFPQTPYDQASVSFDPATHYLLTAHFGVDLLDSNQQVIVVVMANTNSSLTLHRFNQAAGLNLHFWQSHFFTNPIRIFDVTILQTNFLLSYQDTVTNTYHSMKITKLTLALESDVIVPNPVGGIYISPYNYFFMRRENQKLIDDPSGANIILTSGSYTAAPESIKYIRTKDFSKLFTFYSDQPHFFVRNLYSNVTNVLSEWPFTNQVNLPAPGIQCACVNAYETILYILQLDGKILSYTIASNALNVVAMTNYTGITDCYFDKPNNAIVFLQPPNLKLFSLNSLSELFVHTMTSNFLHLVGSTVALRFLTIDTNKIYLSLVSNNPPCADGLYYENSNQTCNACPNDCSTCVTSSYCLTCVSGYIINSTSCIVDTTPSQSEDQNFFEQNIKYLLENDVIKTANRIPAGRRALPFLYFLASIDELWLYQYHQRYYGSVMDTLFTGVQKLQNQKWRLMEQRTTEKLYEKAGTSRQGIFQVIDSKLNYTQPRFRQIEDRGQTFLPACWEFITFNLLFILIGFIMLRWGFKLLRSYRVSKILRPFSLLVYLSPLLLDGNLQYFFFLLFSQVRMGFSLNPRDKAINVLNYLFYLCVFWVSVVSCFLAYWLSRHLGKNILKNWRVRLNGLLAYSLINTMRMLVFGGIHSLLRSHPIQLPLLLGSEVLYVMFLLFCMNFWRAHMVIWKILFTISFSFLRMAIQFILIFQQRQGVAGTGSEADLLVENILGVILLIYLIVMYMGIAWDFISEIMQMFTPEPQNSHHNGKDKKKPSKREIENRRSSKTQNQILKLKKTDDDSKNLKKKVRFESNKKVSEIQEKRTNSNRKTGFKKVIVNESNEIIAELKP